MKKKLLVSVSGGETSLYMAWWLFTHKQDEYDMIFVFANTGQENRETLILIDWFSKYFNIPIVWLEAIMIHGKRVGASYKIVDYKNADMDGKPFEDMIKKHGIPNSAYPHCTRELKTVPIHKYAKSVFGKEKYFTAIGIRIDEIDRLDADRVKKRFIYPLVCDIPMTKKKINFWWSQQDYRLQLKGYQGNCITCWKKSDKKLYTIAQENENNFIFMSKMEDRYSKYIPESRLKIMEKKGTLPVYPITFFRKNRSAIEIVKESKQFIGSVINDADEYEESCEPHRECK